MKSAIIFTTFTAALGFRIPQNTLGSASQWEAPGENDCEITSRQRAKVRTCNAKTIQYQFEGHVQ